MADIIQMTQLSPTMEEGLLVEWLVKEGDSVEVGDLIVEIETDKATMEMESYFDGTILKILVQADESVPIGGALAIIGEPDENIDDLLQEIKNQSGASVEPSESDEKSDAAEQKSDAEQEPKTETSKAEDTEIEDAPKAKTEAASAPKKSKRKAGERVLSSPLARKIAEKHDLDLENIDGSGPGGRIIQRDVEEALERGTSAPKSAPKAATAPTAEDQRIKLTPMRKAVAQNTTEAWKIPAFMLTRKIRMDQLVAFRAQINDALKNQEDAPRISINDLIIKAVALALQEVPEVNVAFQNDSILQYGTTRIGIAVALDGGLITPVIENAEHKGLREIAVEVRELADRARNKRLKAEEYSNASFSISNLGMFDIDHFTAVLNPPGAAILAVGKSAPELVPADNDRGFTQQTTMHVTLTCDHRAIDGALGAQWLQALARYLETPATMLL